MPVAPDGVLLELVGDVMGVLDIGEFRRGLLTSLQRAVPSDWVSINEVTPDRVFAITEPDLDQAWLDLFTELAHENPLYQRYLHTGDGRSYRFSDVTTREELEATELYRRFYEPLGVRHQIAFTLPSEPDRVLAIALSREDSDYTDDERDLLDRARPFLIQAYNNAVAYSEREEDPTAKLESVLLRAGLTAREAEVMRLVALGGSNRDIAARLGLSDRTVQKHLERAFPKLGATTRSAAAATAWKMAGRAP